VIKTTKYSLQVVKMCLKQIQDGRQPPSWKKRRIAISSQQF